MSLEPSRILLDSVGHCRLELERCSTGLTFMDHTFTLARDHVDEAQAEYDGWEAEAAADARPSTGSITATEIKGRITVWIANNPDALASKRRLDAAKATLDKLARYYRTLEHRAGAAQSALKSHLSESSLSGHGNQGQR